MGVTLTSVINLPCGCMDYDTESVTRNQSLISCDCLEFDVKRFAHPGSFSALLLQEIDTSRQGLMVMGWLLTVALRSFKSSPIN